MVVRLVSVFEVMVFEVMVFEVMVFEVMVFEVVVFEVIVFVVIKFVVSTPRTAGACSSASGGRRFGFYPPPTIGKQRHIHPTDSNTNEQGTSVTLGRENYRFRLSRGQPHHYLWRHWHAMWPWQTTASP